jgi:hypothetical protein
LATLIVAIASFLSTGQYVFAMKGQILQIRIHIHTPAQLSGFLVGSPGVLSGNVVQVPVKIPVNVCGNTLIGPGIGNSCNSK